jgi:hypothetical protein
MIESEPLFHLDVQVGPISSLGPGPYGERRVVPIVGGTVSGPGIAGNVVPGGADWQILRVDGVLDIEARYAVRTDAGDLFEILSQGYRFGPPEVMERLTRGELVSASEYFFRAVMRFQTGSVALAHLNRTIGIARGHRELGWVRLEVERIL